MGAKEVTLGDAILGEFVDRTYNKWNTIAYQLGRITGEQILDVVYVFNKVIGEEQARMNDKVFSQLSNKKDRNGIYNKLSGVLEVGKDLELKVKDEFIYELGVDFINEMYLTGKDKNTEDLRLEDEVVVLPTRGTILGLEGEVLKDRHIRNSVVLPADKVKSKLKDLEGIEINLEDVGGKG